MLKSLENSSHHLNPENILRRGFSITSINGKILKNFEEIKNDDMIDTQLYIGTLKSKVVEKKGRIG
jgi:exodeoxyribonuclease VII large subunit